MTKQQLFNNHTTIVQQRKTIKNENEAHQWNTTMKNNIETQQ
jgi:hypothetical protein